MDNNIREALYNLIDEIENSDLIKQLDNNKQKINENNEVQELITIFNEKKKNINEDLQIAKIKLYNNDIIREYLSCEQELNFIIMRLNKKLNNLIDKKGCR